MRALLVAVGFLTRVPVPVRVFEDERAKSRSLTFGGAAMVLLAMPR